MIMVTANTFILILILMEVTVVLVMKTHALWPRNSWHTAGPGGN